MPGIHRSKPVQKLVIDPVLLEVIRVPPPLLDLGAKVI